MLGPVVGVAAMVGAVGLTESAKGDLKDEAVAARHEPDHRRRPAGRSVSRTRRCRPTSVHRVEAVPTRGAGVGRRRGQRRAHAAERGVREATTRRSRCRCWPPTAGCPGCSRCRWTAGGGCAAATAWTTTRAAVIGSGLAKEYGVIPGEIRIAPPQRRSTTASSACSARSSSIPTSTTRCSSRSRRRSTTSTPRANRRSSTCVRPRGRPSRTADVLPTAINLGGPESVSTKIPSDALQASAQADETLQQTALFAGILALAVGGLGIANVMSISVIQRSSEIGIRRALGQHAGDRSRCSSCSRRCSSASSAASSARRSGSASCISSPRSRTGSW